jgi:hypothetical protein
VKKNKKLNSEILDIKLSEPLIKYGKEDGFKVFSSFDEQSEYEYQQLSKLSGIEILIHLRKFINIAYAMHGYNPENLPQKHSIKIVSGEYI